MEKKIEFKYKIRKEIWNHGVFYCYDWEETETGNHGTSHLFKTRSEAKRDAEMEKSMFFDRLNK